MVAIKIYELGEIPADIETLADFRRWTTSEDFPERGRIDYIDGHIEVDMAPDRINSHSLVVSEIAGTLHKIVTENNLGQLLGSQTRIASDPAGLSCEPDVKVVLWESLKSGRVKYVQAPGSSDPFDVIEVDGGPDIVVEIISPSSIPKDTQQLPPALFKAGVREYWLADALGTKVAFTIFRRGRKAFEPVHRDTKGFVRSDVLAQSFKLTRRLGPVEHSWIYKLEHHA